MEKLMKKRKLLFTFCLLFSLVIMILSADQKCPYSDSKERMHCPIAIKEALVEVVKIDNGIKISIISDDREVVKKIKEEAKLHQEELSKRSLSNVCSIESASCEEACVCVVEGAEMKVIEKEKGVEIEITSSNPLLIKAIQDKMEEIKKYRQSLEKKQSRVG